MYYNYANHESVSQDSYGSMNLYAAIQPNDERWEIAAFARNVSDQRYFHNSRTSSGNFPVPDPPAWVLQTRSVSKHVNHIARLNFQCERIVTRCFFNV